jgi:hypothetical protein
MIKFRGEWSKTTSLVETAEWDFSRLGGGGEESKGAAGSPAVLRTYTTISASPPYPP